MPGLAARLAASLCAGIGGHAGSGEVEGAHFAFRPLSGSPAQMRAWRPAILSDRTVVLFHGHVANAAGLSEELGCSPRDLATLYGRAVERWGDASDRRVIGEYCAVVVHLPKRTVRLARSPLRAPPLHYHHSGDFVAAASVPRAILAAGVDGRLNRRHVADSAFFNFSDHEASWYAELKRVPLGCTVVLEPGRSRRLNLFYDVLALPDVHLARDEDYIARAGELLDEAVRVALAGSSRPGATLSSGLDSPQIAVRALKALPPDRRLPTFTFVPEAGWDGIVAEGLNGDEGPMVRDFAALHPRIDPHFTDNAGIAHDHRWMEMFHTMGGAPNGLCNMYVMHGIWQLARDHGCDRLLQSEWGNFAFSAKGEWGFVEYLRKGRWQQLYRMLRDHPNDPRSLLRRFIALSVVPLVPNRLWPLMMRLWHRGDRLPIDMLCPLRSDFRQATGVDERNQKADYVFGRYQPHNRLQAQAQLFSNSDAEGSDIFQAFEQLYGIEQRDPMAYRPFVEFCLGLPVEMFMRDGEMRWLAKEMGRGIMPEEQRANRRNGRWDSDWHLRIGRKREQWLAQLDRIEADPELGAMLDVPRLRASLEDFPAQTAVDRQVWMPLEMAVPRGLLTAEFVRYAEARNEP